MINTDNINIHIDVKEYMDISKAKCMHYNCDNQADTILVIFNKKSTTFIDNKAKVDASIIKMCYKHNNMLIKLLANDLTVLNLEKIYKDNFTPSLGDIL